MRSSSSDWPLFKTITPSSKGKQSRDLFGYSVDASEDGDILMIGAPGAYILNFSKGKGYTIMYDFTP